MTGQVELADIIAAVHTVVAGVTGIRYAPDSLPGTISQWPAAVVYQRDGYYQTSRAGIEEAYLNLVVEIHIPFKDLGRDAITLAPYWKSIPTALTDDPTLNKCVEFGEKIRFTWGPMQYGGTDTIGWQFTLENLKIYPYGFKDKW